MGLKDYFPGYDIPPVIVPDVCDNTEIFDIITGIKYGEIPNKIRTNDAQVQGPRQLGEVFHNLRNKQAKYAAEEFLDKYLELTDDGLLFKMFLAIKKELSNRNAQEEKTEKE